MGSAVVGAYVGNKLLLEPLQNESTDAENSKPDADEKPKRSRRQSVSVQGEADANATDDEGDLVCDYCGQPLTTEYGHPNSREFDHEEPYTEGGGQ